MFSEFMIRAMLSGVVVAIVTGVLGCFVVWRRMAYFGDALSHASVLGVALSMGLGISIYFGVGFIAIALAVLLWALANRQQSMDTVLGVIAHSALAFGLIAAAIWGRGFSLEAILFGDILALSWGDVGFVAVGGGLILSIVIWRWRRFMMATLGDDLAASVGIDARREQFVLALILAITVGLALKIVGALLITAFLIIPAAAARGFSRNPEPMAVISVAIGVFAAIAGLMMAYTWDLPAGPAMVAVAAAVFVVSQAVRV